MTATATPAQQRGAARAGDARRGRKGSAGARLHRSLAGTAGRVVLWVLVVLWTVPSLGLFVSSFRSEAAIRTSGWWTSLANPDLSLDNYRRVLSATGSDAPNMFNHFLNSLAIVIPATVVPIAIAAIAAYAFAFMRFKGRDWLFVGVVALMAVPLQMSLIPLLQLYTGGAHLTLPFTETTVALIPALDLNGTPASVWLTHTGFGLPLAIFLLRNYMSTLPSEIIESARVDGGDHLSIFWRLVVPLSMPALAAFGIFQFLWTWNDYLIAVTFVGSNPDAAPMTVRLATLVGSRGQDWHILTAAAFITTLLPLVVFFSLQRYFVRGLLAGSAKG